MKLKIVFISIISTIIAIGTTTTYAARPDCIGGTCQDFEWSESAQTFLCGSDSDDCSCNTYSDQKRYTCGCLHDYDCSAANTYCDNGTCRTCKTCSNCTSGNWENYGTGYQRIQIKSCGCATGTCNSYYSYQCASGYYGSTSNGTSGCTQCPTATNVYTNSTRTTLARGTSSAGAKTISECKIAAGTYYDTSGTFKLDTTCGY